MDFHFNRENDQQVEIGEIDDRVKQQQPDAEEEKRNERIKEFFRKIAGEDLEVDWIELKQILDYAMKNGIYFHNIQIISHLQLSVLWSSTRIWCFGSTVFYEFPFGNITTTQCTRMCIGLSTWSLKE